MLRRCMAPRGAVGLPTVPARGVVKLMNEAAAANYGCLPIPPLSTPTARAMHAPPLHPAALASVPYGVVLVRVRDRLQLYSGYPVLRGGGILPGGVVLVALRRPGNESKKTTSTQLHLCHCALLLLV